MKAIIPTGGRGTRMQPLTFSTNKHFIPVGNKPLIFYPVEAVAEAGIRDVLITYNPGWLESAKSVLGDGSRWGLNFTFVLQEKPLGLANIFQVCEKYLDGDSFVFHLGDNIFVDGIKDQVEHFLKKKPSGMVTMVKHKENSRLGVPVFDDSGRLIDYLEKPENPPNEYAIPGIYFFDSNVFKCFEGKDRIKPSERGEYEISSPFLWLIKHGYKVDVVKYEGKWLDPGKFDDWLDSNKYLLSNKFVSRRESEIGDDNGIEGNVAVGKRCKIRNSQIKGPVDIGDDVSIINSHIGPYASIFDNCTIEESEVADSVLMAGVNISKVKTPITASIIGADSEITSNGENGRKLNLFVGEKSKVKI